MKIVIQGAGEVGSHLAKMLSLEANDITVIDDDPQRLANISSIADVIAIEGAPSSLRVMREADVQDADLFISVVPFVPQDVNIVSALLAKNLGAKKVTARIDDNDFLSAENKLLFKQTRQKIMAKYGSKATRAAIKGQKEYIKAMKSVNLTNSGSGAFLTKDPNR